MGYNLFQPATLGMKTQAHALNTIGINVANVNTGGYKRTDTRFETMISKTLQHESDLGGVKPKDYQRIDKQGFLSSSDRNLDLAINGDGFFYVSPTFQVSTEIFFTRDGSFEMGLADAQTSSVTADDGSTITINNGYLVDKNGYYVLGIAPDATTGTFSSTGALAPMRIDEYAFINTSTPTTTSSLHVNLPSEKAPSLTVTDAEQYNIDLVDSLGVTRSISLNFYKTQTDNTWQIVPTADNATALSLSGAAFAFTAGTANNVVFTDNGTSDSIQVVNATTGNAVPDSFLGLKAGDTITVAGTTDGADADTLGDNDGTFTISSVSSDGSTIILSTSDSLTTATDTAASVAVSSTQVVASALTFNGDGTLSTPTTPYTVTATWSTGATSSFTLDLSNTTQFAGGFLPFTYSHNGEAAANMTDVRFDSAGQVIGSFTDGTERTVYKVPLAIFQNPDQLHMMNGMVFDETTESGSPVATFADASERAEFVPNAFEISNVDLANEFTRMIMVQKAYNSSATVFRTIDEMVGVARDLKA